MSTAPHPYDIRDAWMAEGYAWHGLPAREAAKVPVKRAVRHRTRGNSAERQRLACTSQIDSCTGLLQDMRRWDRFYCVDGVVLDANANAACNIPARLYDEEITLYTPHGEVKALLAERTRLSVGTARPGLELRGLAMLPSSTESESPAPVPICTG